MRCFFTHIAASTLWIALALVSFAHAEASDPVSPFAAAIECVSRLNPGKPESKQVFVDCVSERFSKETHPGLVERFAYWFATLPNIDHIRVCSTDEAKRSGDHWHSDAVGCFEILDQKKVMTGYFFLRKKNATWLLLNIKY